MRFVGAIRDLDGILKGTGYDCSETRFLSDFYITNNKKNTLPFLA